MLSQDNHSWKRIIEGGISLLSVSACLFQIYLGFWVVKADRIIHVMFFLSLCFLVFPLSKSFKHKKESLFFNFVDLICFLLAIGCSVYMLRDYNAFIYRAGELVLSDVVMGTILIILILEASRRISALPLTIFGIFALIYTYYGRFFPGMFAHQGYTWERAVETLVVHDTGVYGIPVGVATAYISLFIIFGEFIRQAGIDQLFIDAAKVLIGRQSGGIGKIAVISSALFGTISGSAVANVAVTGSFTIPAMKRTGYHAHMAGGVEAVASTGGMIMPPVMGAAAFVMAELLGIPYLRVCVIATIPAIFYFVSFYSTVHFYCAGHGLRGLEKHEIPSPKKVMIDRGHLLIPVAVLVSQIVMKRSVGRSVAVAILAAFVVALSRKISRMNLRTVWNTLNAAGRKIIPLSVMCMAAGIIIGGVTLTGVGLKFSTVVINLAGGKLFVGLVLTSIICLILGMGIPAAASYITTAILCAPALIKLGANPLAAHLFILYYATLSAITPPVMMASYTAAGIAKAPIMKTALASCKLGFGAYIIPYLLVYCPAVMILESSLFEILWASIPALLGVFGIAMGVIGSDFFGERLSVILRVLFSLGGILCFTPYTWLKIIGIGVFVLLCFFRISARRNEIGLPAEKERIELSSEAGKIELSSWRE